MADNRSIVITLKLDDNDDETVEKETKLEKTSSENDKSKTAKATFTALAFQASELVTSEIVNWAEYYWNRELTLEDDYVGQRNKTIALTQINRAVSAVTTIGTFTAMGAKAGPIGAAVGALLGVATVGAGIVRSNIQGQDQQNIMLRQMDAQLGYTRSRAGWSLQAASIGEDL